MENYNEALKRLAEVKPDASEARTDKTVNLDDGTTLTLRAKGVRPKSFDDSAVKDAIGKTAKVALRGMNDAETGIGFRDTLSGAQAVAFAWGKPPVKDKGKGKTKPAVEGQAFELDLAERGQVQVGAGTDNGQ